jgi:hypothetical protein
MPLPDRPLEVVIPEGQSVDFSLKQWLAINRATKDHDEVAAIEATYAAMTQVYGWTEEEVDAVLLSEMAELMDKIKAHAKEVQAKAVPPSPKKS